MNTYPIYNGKGEPRPDAFDGYPTIGFIGVYEVRLRRHGVGRSEIEYPVVCPPEMRAPNRWNVTAFMLEENGLLNPRDHDVELDPYHMCLLYQLVKEKMIDGTLDRV